MIIAIPERKLMAQIKKKIHTKFPMTDKGPISFFLNMHFTRDRKAAHYTIHQETKISKLLSDSRLTKDEREYFSRPCKTPADSNVILTKEMCPVSGVDIETMSTKPYKSYIGQLLYIAITARPDLAPAVSAAGRYAQTPGKEH
jgi:hypothetical protein